MRIAYLGTMGIPARYGGFETCVEEVATRLTKQGHEVIVYCGYRGSKPKNTTYKGVKLVYIPCLSKKFLDFPFRAFLSTIDVLRRNVDVVHFYGSDAWPFTFVTRLLSIKTVLTLDGLVWKRSSYPKFVRKLLLLTAKCALFFPNCTIVDSKYVQRWYRKNFGKTPIYVPYGANISLAQPNELTLHEKGLQNNKYVLFVGRLVREKGVHYLITAFNKVKTDLKLVIVGDDPYKSDYELFLKKNANKNTLFLGAVYGKDCESLYRGACIYVSASDLEGTSPALLTAMGLGKCVLVSGIPENLETIGSAGFSFNQGDAEDLRMKLQLLLANPSLIEKVGNQALDRVNTNYNWDLITSRLKKIYLLNICSLRDAEQLISAEQVKNELVKKVIKN